MIGRLGRTVSKNMSACPGPKSRSLGHRNATSGRTFLLCRRQAAGQATQLRRRVRASPKDATGDQPSGTGGMTDDSAANVPDADGDDSVQNQGALSAPEKDSNKM